MREDNFIINNLSMVASLSMSLPTVKSDGIIIVAKKN
jgi:hypothetical protein